MKDKKPEKPTVAAIRKELGQRLLATCKRNPNNNISQKPAEPVIHGGGKP